MTDFKMEGLQNYRVQNKSAQRQNTQLPNLLYVLLCQALSA